MHGFWIVLADTPPLVAVCACVCFCDAMCMSFLIVLAYMPPFHMCCVGNHLVDIFVCFFFVFCVFYAMCMGLPIG